MGFFEHSLRLVLSLEKGRRAMHPTDYRHPEVFYCGIGCSNIFFRVLA